MKSEDAFLHVQALGAKFAALQVKLADFRMLTNPVYRRSTLNELEEIQNELVQSNLANVLVDGSLVIKTDFLISFLKPNVSINLAARGTGRIDLKNKTVIRQIALTCSMNQWRFLAEQCVEKEDQAEFIRSCVRALEQDQDNKPDLE